MHRSAGRPDVVEEEISPPRIDFSGPRQSVSGSGLGFTGFGIGADLDGVFRASEEFFDFSVLAAGAADFSEVSRDEVSMVEAAGADVFFNGREGNDRQLRFFGGGENGVGNFGERASESADGVELKIVN